jgi:tRNA threonylcarbamoyladenosine biosynthesis protein TsaE
MGRRIILSSSEETFAQGVKMALSLPPQSILALFGPLGAGKTTFVQGMASALGIQERIQSPTFVLLNSYDKLNHFDLYRLKSSADFLSLGFDEQLAENKITAIEWPERIEDILPENTIKIHFSYAGDQRIMEIV